MNKAIINLEEIEKEVLKVSSKFIGEPVNKDTINGLKASIRDLSGKSVNVIKCDLAWNVMRLREKLLWWISTTVFPSIKKELVKFMPNGSPLWLIEDPKTVIVADVKISCPLPLQAISVSLSIQEKCWENAAKWSKEDFAESDKNFIERLKQIV